VYENVFAVFSTLIVGFIYGGLAGVLSSIMMTQNVGEQEHMLRLLQIKVSTCDARASLEQCTALRCGRVGGAARC
jgi:hypothetical protein